MILQYIKGLFILAVMTFCVPVLAKSVSGSSKSSESSGYFVFHKIKSLSADGAKCTLDDGSTWSFINKVDLSWKKGDTVWIMPIIEGVGMQLTAVLFDNYLNAATAYMNSGSTTLKIKASSMSGIIELSDGSQWKIEPTYERYTAIWTLNDPITIVGKHDEYYLINAGQTGMTMTYCMASKFNGL